MGRRDTKLQREECEASYLRGRRDESHRICMLVASMADDAAKLLRPALSAMREAQLAGDRDAYNKHSREIVRVECERGLLCDLLLKIHKDEA